MIVRFLHGSSTNPRRCMAVPQRTTRVNDGGITDNHDATTVRNSACTVQPVAPRAPTIAYGLMMIVMMIFGILFNLFGEKL